jgi:hypothetical protein
LRLLELLLAHVRPDRPIASSVEGTGPVDDAGGWTDDPTMSDDLDPREAERARRRDREAAAEQRALMRSGMGKVFKQIQDAQAKAAKVPPTKRPRPRPKSAG